MTRIYIDGRESPLEETTYSVMALDRRKTKGGHKYQLRIPLDEFREKLESSYEQERRQMKGSLVDSDTPDFNGLLKNRDLLKKVLIGWYGYAVFKTFLAPKNPRWYVVSFDDVNVSLEEITLEGTLASEEELKRLTAGE